MVSITKLLGALALVAVGTALIFGGFELAAYEHTLADREVTTEGTVTETDVWQLPDGNWTYEFTYEYVVDQEEEITSQGLEDVYPDEMSGEQQYRTLESGGEYGSETSARTAMEKKFDDDGTLVVYVDPFNPDDSSLTDATSAMPRILQYAGSAVLALGLLGLARMARRVSA
jgi:hypothetical protein